MIKNIQHMYNRKNIWVFQHSDWRHQESWSISIYYTRASSCINKLGYGTYRTQKVADIQVSHCVSRLSSCVFSMHGDFPVKIRTMHKKPSSMFTKKGSLCQCVNTKTQWEELLRQDKWLYVVPLHTWQAIHSNDHHFKLSHVRGLWPTVESTTPVKC